jgi:L-asparagine transporter-like permease
VDFRMPGAPVTAWAGILALGAVFVSMVLPGTSDSWWMSLAGTALLLAGITAGYEINCRRRPVRPAVHRPEALRP